MSETRLDVVGIGNAIVDVLAQAEDAFLEEQKLVKGSMTLIDMARAEQLYASMGPALESSGGSAGNTLAGVGSLGGKGGFIGRVRNDQLGGIFHHDITSGGIRFSNPPAVEGPPTARCMIFVTPDAQRTMSTYLGAAVELGPEDLDKDMIAEAKVLYLEGYLWDTARAKAAFIEAARHAHEHGRMVALTLSDSFCVERHREGFLDLMQGHVDLLFANEDEITSLYHVETLEAAIDHVRGHCTIAALTRSEKGSVLVTADEVIEIKAISLGNLVDTTGAGDLYASGFLYGYTAGYDLATCGRLGSLAAGECITHMGPRPMTSLAALAEQHLGMKRAG